MERDEFISLLDQLDEARRALAAELETLGRSIAETREARLNGAPLASILDGAGTAARERVVEALQRFSITLARTRSAAVRALVDQEGFTFTQIAKQMGKTRQLVSRLYRIEAE